MRVVAAIALALLGGCASTGTVMPRGAEQALVAKIVSSREITVFEGGTFLVAFVHEVEPVGQPGRRTELIGLDDCPPEGASDQAYLLFVRRLRVLVAMSDAQPAPKTNVTVVACTPVEAARSSGLGLR